MKYVFHFKKRIMSTAKVHKFVGTWVEFDDKYPGVFLCFYRELED
jgi:hypothetical protein